MRLPGFKCDALFSKIVSRPQLTSLDLTMLKRAVNSHGITNYTKTLQEPQQHSAQIPVTTKHIPPTNVHMPLSANASAINSLRVSLASGVKRKHGQTLSTSSNSGSLPELHEHVYFDENDFEDDECIDIDYSVETTSNVSKLKEPAIQYPSLDSVTYPELPSGPLSPHETPQSSIPVPWSPSPASHWEKPQPSCSSKHTNDASPKDDTQADPRPTKRRTLPWQKEKEVSIEAPKDQNGDQKFSWDISSSLMKSEQKELRRRHPNKAAVVKTTRDKPTNVPATHLSEEQVAVAKAVVDDGKSVFFTGSAGTGKSVLMRSIIARLKIKYTREADRLAITASTGLAACVIEGTTLHSWAGIGLGREPVPELVKKIKRNAKTKAKWLRTKVLIIDEISMVDAELFDKLEGVSRAIRNNGRPFGGIQLVVTGDFFQLPPVPEKNSEAKFAFDAANWSTCIQHTILLTHVFRQKDPQFANMLNEMRIGKLSDDSIQAFEKLSRPLDFADDLDATELFPTRGEVDAANNSRMRRLSGKEMKFAAQDTGVNDTVVRDKILANFMAPETLTLKKGAQVMLIKNIDTQLVNGTLGKVLAFMDELCFAAFKEDEETYHMAMEPEEGGDEEAKAAARKRFNAARYRNKDVAATRYWPMVRFRLPDGTSRDLLCMPEEWKTENQQGEILARRTQVPLILAWALSIHKAQGQTLSRVKVDLGRVFERGQAYVALSRATSQAGLQVQKFDARRVMVHPKVVLFYEKLVGVDSIMPKTAEKGGVTVQAHERRLVSLEDKEDHDGDDDKKKWILHA